jgi:hypothetical protein
MTGTLTIKRKPENGGDKAYSAVDELVADFASMTLHPGDLKPAIKDSSMCASLSSAVENCSVGRYVQTALHRDANGWNATVQRLMVGVAK